MFYVSTKWNDENVNKVCANQITIQEFFEKCRPDMDKDLRQELFYHYFHDYFHDHEYRINPEWLAKQLGRVDSDERVIAFYESIFDAITTDTEDWSAKGRDIMVALMENNATALLIALCGWGAESLAKRVFMKCGCPQYQDEEKEAVLKVDWSDGKRTSVPCIILHEDHWVYNFDRSVFYREDEPTAMIEKVFVRFKPFENGNEYDFRCISEDERKRTNDEDVFWYAAEENEEEMEEECS